MACGRTYGGHRGLTSALALDRLSASTVARIGTAESMDAVRVKPLPAALLGLILLFTAAALSLSWGLEPLLRHPPVRRDGHCSRGHGGADHLEAPRPPDGLAVPAVRAADHFRRLRPGLRPTRRGGGLGGRRGRSVVRDLELDTPGLLLDAAFPALSYGSAAQPPLAERDLGRPDRHGPAHPGPVAHIRPRCRILEREQSAGGGGPPLGLPVRRGGGAVPRRDPRLSRLAGGPLPAFGRRSSASR